MNKKDLINGSIVETRTGIRYLVLDEYLLNLVSLDSYNELKGYRDDLTSICDKPFDIVKVKIPTQTFSIKEVFCSNASNEHKGVWSWIRPNKPKLTDDEKAILRNLPKEYKYIARDKDTDLYVYKLKPHKGISAWGNSGCISIDIFKHLFSFIKWEDEEPYLIEDLLKD